MSTIKNEIYLALQADYHLITIGLYQNHVLKEKRVVLKMHASEFLMVEIKNILENNKCSFDALQFIAVNQGPAPFTTLRVVITTANGLNFSHKIPLVGVDSLRTFAQEKHGFTDVSIVLLNAFSNDIYFAINEYGSIETGSENIDTFLEKITSKFPTISLTFIGNGVDLFKEKISNALREKAVFVTPNPEYTNFEKFAQTAYHQWQNKMNVVNMLLPLYLKMQNYKPST